MTGFVSKKKKKEGLYTGTAGRAPCCLGMLTQNVIMLGGKISSANPWNDFERNREVIYFYS